MIRVANDAGKLGGDTGIAVRSDKARNGDTHLHSAVQTPQISIRIHNCQRTLTWRTIGASATSCQQVVDNICENREERTRVAAAAGRHQVV